MGAIKFNELAAVKLDDLLNCQLQELFHCLKQILKNPFVQFPYVDPQILFLVLPGSLSLLCDTSWELIGQDARKSVDIRPLLGGLCCLSEGSVEDKLSFLLTLFHPDQSLLTRCDVGELLTASLLGINSLLQSVRESAYWNSSEEGAVNILVLVDVLLNEIFTHAKDEVVSASYLCQWAVNNDLDLAAMSGLSPKTKRIQTGASPATQVIGDYSANKTASYKWHELVREDDEPGPSARCKHAVCLHEGCVYVHAGKSGTLAQKDLWRWNLADNKWTKLSCHGDRPALLQDHTMLAFKKKLYVFGGEFACNGSDDTPLWILDLESSKWVKHSVGDTEVATPSTRRGHTAVLYNRTMYIYGGYMDLRGSTSDLWIFDIPNSMWHLAYNSQMSSEGPGARHDHSAVVHDGAMWVYGGMTDLIPRADLWKWDFRVRTWCKLKCRGPPELHGHSAGKIGDSMLIFGGECNGTLQNDIWSFNFSSHAWTKLHTPSAVPPSRTDHSVVMAPAFLCQPAAAPGSSARSKSVPYLREPASHSLRPHTSPANHEAATTWLPHTRVTPVADLTSHHEVDCDKLFTVPDISPDHINLERMDIEHVGTDNQAFVETSFINTSVIPNDHNVPVGSKGGRTGGAGEQQGTGKVKRKSGTFSSSEDLLLAGSLDGVPLLPHTWTLSYHDLESFSLVDRCYDNPMFRQDSLSSTCDSIPMKRLRRSLDSLDSATKEPLIRFSSAESILSFDYALKAYNKDRAVSTEKGSNAHLKQPRTVKRRVKRSDSLDVLLDRIGSVQLGYGTCDTVLGNSRDLILEDIEDIDMESLHSSHVIYKSQSCDNQIDALCTDQSLIMLHEGSAYLGAMGQSDQCLYRGDILQESACADFDTHFLHPESKHYLSPCDSSCEQDSRQWNTSSTSSLQPSCPKCSSHHVAQECPGGSRRSSIVTPPVPCSPVTKEKFNQQGEQQLDVVSNHPAITPPVPDTRGKMQLQHNGVNVSRIPEPKDIAVSQPTESVQKATRCSIDVHHASLQSQIIQSNMSKLSDISPGGVCMLVLGGREAESTSFGLKPLSVWQLNMNL